MSFEVITNAEAFHDNTIKKFSGRSLILDEINKNIQLIEQGEGQPIINLFGIGGIGKTSILQYVLFDLKKEKVFSAFVDFKENNFDLFGVIDSLYESLSNAVSRSHFSFKKYTAVQKNIRKIENKLVKNITKSDKSLLSDLLSASIPQTTTELATSLSETVQPVVADSSNISLPTLLGVTGSAVAGGVGMAIGTGLGIAISKLIEHSRQECITVLSQAGLKRADIDALLNYKQSIIKAFIEDVNELAEKSKILILGFDTFEKVSATMSIWLRKEFLPNLNHKIVIFICGKEKVTTDMLWKDISSFIYPINVGLFSPEEAKEYLNNRGISDDDSIKLIIRLTGLLPWALALAVDSIEESNKVVESNFAETLDEERIGEQVVGRFLDHIKDENLKDAIYLCASANYFTFDILSEFFNYQSEEKRVDNDTIIDIFKKIRDYSFTRKLDGEKYAIHDVVSDFLIKGQKRFNITKYKNQCQFLCDYYKNNIDSTCDIVEKSKMQWECLFHQINYDETEALDIIDRFLVDSIPSVPLDVFEEYLYAGLTKYNFSTSSGMLYNIFSMAQTSYITGDWDQAIELLKKTIEDSTAYDRFALVECGEITLAEIYLGQGHYKDAKMLLEGLMSRSQMLTLRKRKKASAKLNELYAILGNYSKGEKIALESKAASELENDFIGVAWSCKALGDIYRLWGKQEKSIDSLKQGLKIFIQCHDIFGEAVVRTQLARDYIHIGKWNEAEQELEISEKIYKQYDYKYGIANISLFRGNILRLKHQWDNALDCYQKALNMHIAMQSWREISPLWGSLGLVYFHLGDREKADKYFEKSRSLKIEQGYIRGVMVTQIYIGDCFFAENQWDNAIESYELGRSANKKKTQPIYICCEIDLKIYLCMLAKQEYSKEKIEEQYNNIKRKAVKYNYNHLVASLEYYFCKFQEDLSVHDLKKHIDDCMKYAGKYNEFLHRYYVDCFRSMIRGRFSGEEKVLLEAQLI